MDGNIVGYALHYSGILIEAALIIYVAWGRRLKSEFTPAFYVAFLLAADVGRMCVLRLHGLASRQYYYVYWSTDFLLVMAAFFLVCLFFRRACLHQEKMWRFVRLFLAFTTVLVVGISGLSFSHNYSRLFLEFVTEFNQNLYFTCLVLNTLLYLLLQYIDSIDDQLGLLVCGVGIQFAGPAASLALYHITGGEPFAQSLTTSIMRLCSFGMLLVWGYAIVLGKGKKTAVARRENPVPAEG